MSAIASIAAGSPPVWCGTAFRGRSCRAGSSTRATGLQVAGGSLSGAGAAARADVDPGADAVHRVVDRCGWSQSVLARATAIEDGPQSGALVKEHPGVRPWLRGRITPPQGDGLAMLDWSAQEIAIAAGRSGDPRMVSAYLTGDVHMAVAIDAKLAPSGASKATHPVERERAKAVSLGTNYGISPYGIAAALGIPVAEGRDLLRAHHDAYPVFWSWLTHTVDTAMLTSSITAPMGWQMQVVGEPNPRAIQNWMMQASGAEMLRAAVVKMVHAGLTLCATAHDAIMIEAPVEGLAEEVALAREIMERVCSASPAG